ncbi:MAG: DUF3786 domain-containing protein [Treponema sp.]|jgi:hypothetical protein|nr:DUF3786 domain-containing protein [Treponema sp.]
MANGYEKTYETITPRLRDLDFPYAALRLGFDLIDKYRMSIDFLGRKYELDREGVRPVDGEKVNVNFLSVLVYYAISKGNTEPLYDFALLNSFSGGLFSGGGSGSGWMVEPIRKTCGGNYEKFRRAARDLGMIYEGSRVTAEHTWQYRLLPKIPALIKYFEADEEFPCDVKIYYDKTVPEYLDFEPLAVLNGCLVAAITAAAEFHYNI